MNEFLLACRKMWTAARRRKRYGVKTLFFATLLSVPCGAYSSGSGMSGKTVASVQQTKSPVSGVVTDKGGMPLIGVNIVESPINGTTTDVDGRFTLSVSPSSVLTVSYLGYKSQEVPVGNKTSFSIVLEEDAETMEEVVVVGYGSQKKVSVTGSVATIQSKDLKQSSSASLSAALAGRLSGVTALQSSGGQPGRDEAVMMLRGAATTNQTAPLILIDGVPRDNMNYLSADEVASVSVLKDASATAVFGVRGANGVILITTKRGSEGKTEVSLNFEQSWTGFTFENSRLHSLEYMNLRNEAFRNDGKDEPYSAEYMKRFENPLYGLDPNDPDYERKAMIRNYIYPDNNYYRMMIRKWAPQTRVNVNVSGGTKKLKYYLNANYMHQGGNLKTEPKSYLGYDPSTKMDRYGFRANLDYQVSKSFKAFLNLGSYIDQINMPSAKQYGGDTNHMISSDIHDTFMITPITIGPTTLEGITPGVPGGKVVAPTYMDRSPYEMINRRGSRNEVLSNLNATLGAEWDLSMVTKGLSIKGMASFDSKATTILESDSRQRIYLANVNTETGELSYSEKENGYTPLWYDKTATSLYTINLQASINYNRTFGKHTVGAMVLAQRDYWETTGGDLPYNVIGFAARATYDYDNRYLLEVNMGYNGSEQFAPGQRFGFFPAVSGGWVISNENFLKDNKVITNLKLRASYGEVGNDKLGGSRFLYIDNISMGGGGLVGSSLGNGQIVNEGLLGNNALTWEVAKKQNYGIDMQFFGDLSLSFDYFVEKREGILISRGLVPAIQGISLGNLPKMNMGKVNNRGFEIELNYNKALTEDLSVSFRGNFNYNKNKQIYMDEAPKTEDYAYRYRNTGYPLFTNWGYMIDYSNGNGMFNTQEELDNYVNDKGDPITYSFVAPRLGDFKYKDLNNDGIIDERDQAPLHYTRVPRITYGLTLGVNYKGFDLTVFFQGVSKYSSLRSGWGVYESNGQGTYYDYTRTAWTKERYESGAKITYPALSSQSSANHQPNSFFVMDRSFVRLKNLELGYTLPAGALKALGISNLRIYLSGQNLYTWTSHAHTNVDPETDNMMGYPITRMVNVGLNLSF